MNESNRAEMLAALEVVDFVCLFDEETPAEIIRAVRPDVLVKGADYRPDQVVGADFVQSYGGRLHVAAVCPAHGAFSAQPIGDEQRMGAALRFRVGFGVDRGRAEASGGESGHEGAVR